MAIPLLRTFASEHLKRDTAMKTALKWTLSVLKFVFTNESFRNFIASLLGNRVIKSWEQVAARREFRRKPPHHGAAFRARTVGNNR